MQQCDPDYCSVGQGGTLRTLRLGETTQAAEPTNSSCHWALPPRTGAAAWEELRGEVSSSKGFLGRLF